MVVCFSKLTNTAITPTQAHTSDAGFDLYADLGEIDKIEVIDPNEMHKVSTGINIAIPPGYFGGIYARSGLATKKGLRLANDVGVIDSPYRGEVIVALYNDSPAPQEIRHGDRIAQLIIHPIPIVTLKEVDHLDETDRGGGGFGSTGS